MKTNIVKNFCQGDGGNILVAFPAENDFVAQERTWVFAYTLIMSEEFSQPLFLKFYTFIKADKVYTITLICPDSERKSWNLILKTMLNSITS